MPQMPHGWRGTGCRIDFLRAFFRLREVRLMLLYVFPKDCDPAFRAISSAPTLAVYSEGVILNR